MCQTGSLDRGENTLTDRRRGWAYGTTDDGRYLTIAGSAHKTPKLPDTHEQATPHPIDRDHEAGRVVLALVEEVPHAGVTVTGLAYRVIEVRPRLHILDVHAGNGVPFRVIAHTAGSRPGDGGHATVEFYDRRHPHTEHGQFTGGSYALASLLDDRPRRGLMLHMGVSAWTLDPFTMARVMEWLTGLHQTGALGDA